MSLKEELATLIVKEEMKLGVNSPEFKENHEEIMRLIEKAGWGISHSEKSQFITAKEAASVMGVSEGKAYGIIKELNEQLKEKGYIVIPGKVSRAYFEERCLYGGR